MIHESYYWKRPLLTLAKRIEALSAVELPSESQLVRLEKDIFIGFYSIRKLFESGPKITDKTKSTTVKILSYPNLRPISWLGRFEPDKFYDLGLASQQKRNIRFICNQFIHSYIFMPSVNDKNMVEDILFTSDHWKNEFLFSIKIADVVGIYRLVAEDDVTTVQWNRDPTTGSETFHVE